jgi:DNA-binding GntR family transcriptional regulator
VVRIGVRYSFWNESKVGESQAGRVMLEPIQHLNLTDRVYRTLKDRIISQEIAVGSRLRDEELATQLGVSRTPVREALMHLAREGLVEVIPRSGTRVRTYTEHDIEDIFEVRIPLEVLAIRKAATRLRGEDIARLRQMWQKAETAIAQGDVKPAIEFDLEMHRMILEASGNRRLETLMDRLNQFVALFRNLGASTPGHRNPQFVHRLPEIIEALERRDADGAARALREHIESSGRQTIRDFKNRQLLVDDESD